MKKYFFLLLFTCFLCLCACSRHTINCAEKTPDSNPYKVVNIKKKNSWYFIYLKRNDSIFKVVSKEPSDKMKFEGYCKIKKHRKYNLRLNSFRDITFKGVNVMPIGVSGAKLDSITEVSIEPKKHIWDLYYTYDLKGLYYLK